MTDSVKFFKSLVCSRTTDSVSKSFAVSTALRSVLLSCLGKLSFTLSFLKMYYLITKGDLYLSSPRAQGSTDGYVFSDYSRRWRIYSSNLAQLIAGDIHGANVVPVGD